MLSNQIQALLLIILPCIFACSSDEDRQKEQEDLALSLAMQSQEQENQAKKNENKKKSAVVVSKKKSAEEVDVALGFKGISTQYQGYFRSEEAVKILENGLDLPSPVFVEVQWLDVGNNRGTGEIIVYVEKSITEFSGIAAGSEYTDGLSEMDRCQPRSSDFSLRFDPTRRWLSGSNR